MNNLQKYVNLAKEIEKQKNKELEKKARVNARKMTKNKR